MKTVSSTIDKRKRVLKQVPLSAAEIKRLEDGMRPVDPKIFMINTKQSA